MSRENAYLLRVFKCVLLKNNVSYTLIKDLKPKGVKVSDFKKKFGANLKEIRKSKKITQEKLAELIDLHYRQMSKIETGENFPSCKTLEKLCFALNVSPASLFDFNFFYENEALMTGTGESIFYKATRKNNVLVLEDYKNKTVIEEFLPIWNSDERLSKIAQNVNKNIIVEYFEDGEKSKTITYSPEGLIYSSSKIPGETYTQKDKEKLIDLIKKISNNKNYIEFVELAINALEDNDSLKHLEFIINGIKLSRQVITDK